MGLNRSLTRQPRLLLAGLLVLVGFGAFATNSAAQDETTPLTTFVRLCLEPGCTEDLGLTEAVDGVPVSVMDADTQTEIGACTTGDSEPGACVIDVPSSVTTVTVTLDDAALPEGYSASDNPATFSLADTTEYPFLLMPAEDFPEEEDPDATAPVEEDDDASDDTAVSQLPETGSGQESASSSVLVTGLVTLASMSGVLALVVRRALVRR